MTRFLTTGILAATLPAFPAAAVAAPVDFVRDVRPIFERHCYGCHGPEKQKSGYRLDLKQSALHEGDSHAPNILAGRSSGSPLFQFVSRTDPKTAMPPKKSGAAGLGPEEVEILRRWLDEGAVWPEGVDVAKAEDRMDWWAFKPLTKPSAPVDTSPAVEGSTIDAFLHQSLQKAGLQFSPEASRRTLIRRLSYDLVGLPPLPEEVTAFERDPASDSQAYEKLVDRLLASPRYGERWARHWLDVVHYGETHGYDKDKARPNAWPYRDYVIRAFNEDKPYGRFVEEQIAGDVLHPGTTDGIEALGFIAAGPWDLIGHAEVSETKTDGKIARHLDRDDMVQNTLGTFMSLTAGCAQCHNHKFDPITQADYYSLQAVFAAVDRADKKYYRDPALTKKRAELDFAKLTLTESVRRLEKEVATKAGPELVKLDQQIAVAQKAVPANARPEYGYHSAISPVQNASKWVQVDLGRSVAVDKIVLAPCHDTFNGIGAGFGFPVRYRVELSDDAGFGSANFTLHREDRDQPNPGTALQSLPAGGASGRYVRLTATRLAERQQDYILALAELQVLDASGNNLASGRPVSVLDAVEARPRWSRQNLVDGIAPGLAANSDPGALVSLQSRRTDLLARSTPVLLRQELDQAQERLAETTRQLAAMPAPQIVYAGTVHYGTGNFAGTGASGGTARVVHLLKRGDVKSPDQEMKPGPIAAFERMMGRYDCANPADEGQRRAALARWISRPENPLLWRSIVNRVWQYHFGRGLVDTPNDFGRMGGVPSHPALLDWLAATFRDDLQGSMKGLHKLIVMSQAYRQSSDAPAEATTTALKVDADNHLLWRQNRRKLEAEAVRDTILAVSGRLDLTIGGPSFQDFVVEKPEHSPHYQYHLHDPDDPRSHRRSIYRFIVRSQQQPFMTVLDCADPSMRVDKRNESLSPLQALAMLNNGLTVTMARHFAERVQAEVHGLSLEAQVSRAFTLALGRPPEVEELTTLSAHAAHHGLAGTCRVIMNLNEFTFVD